MRYILVKYVADPRRGESRNIGVIVWHKGETEAKFLPDKAAKKIVNEIDVYRRWVKYFTELLSKEFVRSGRGLPLSRMDEKFLEELARHCGGNYFLADYGESMGGVPSIKKFCEFIFDELVS